MVHTYDYHCNEISHGINQNKLNLYFVLVKKLLICENCKFCSIIEILSSTILKHDFWVIIKTIKLLFSWLCDILIELIIWVFAFDLITIENRDILI